MKHSISAVLLLFLLCSIGSGCVTTRNQASIRGMVFEPSGAPLAFARVQVTMDPEAPPTGREDKLPPQSAIGLAVTSRDGTFAISKLVDGEGAEYSIPRDSDVQVQVYKNRFHPWQQLVSFVRGHTAIDVRLRPDHIRVGRDRSIIDVRPEVEGGSWGGIREGS